MKASIVCVGTELLIGKTTESNSYFLADEMRQYGIYTHHKLIVEDNLKQMVPLMEIALKASDIVVVTGGLGPTLDDITREAVAELTGLPLEINEEAKEHLVQLMSSFNRNFTKNNYRQVYFPKGSKVLKNNNGTASGFITTVNDKMIVVLPGPPREMKPMFQEQVMPIIQEMSPLVFVKRQLNFVGIGESSLEDTLGELMTKQDNPTLATYAGYGSVSLVVTSSGATEEECQERLAPVLKEIEEKVGQYIFSEDKITLEEILQKQLLEKQMTLSVAESCTGGQLASKLTALPGISSVFEGGFVTYSNESKVKVLGVPEETLKTYGAVSEETALAMIKGLKEKLETDCCISITGIAGPGGATEQKPVGLVYIGVNVLEDYEVHQFNFTGNRGRVQNLAVLTAMNLLRKALKADARNL
ncbi:competence/damage-inducible protein A [Alkaliphilus hydrothermalis]|uniref:Putative competence-damage inducible protein n=1 Tax=Alkaliphilus hydrothermalis TaxID=1482730 RepID=A0ABS2NLC7_9FIRM|nr:competence/damage-inducible protein A [Alkaliphilus hydrothermalis]MBM7613729.1 nicotinamide-nucleotide amidase [Alkaliphilus hydrothermalis]